MTDSISLQDRLARLPTWLRVILVFLLLYLFLTGIGLLEGGIKGLGADVTDSLFERVASPVAGLFVGVLATVLVQSSSVTTSTIVGLVGAGIVSVEQAVPLIMGANLGTSVTNTLASVGSIRRPEEFRRAVAAATVHDFFNVLAVIVILPIELATGILARAGAAISGVLVGQAGTTFKSPIKEAVKAPVKAIEGVVEGVIGEGTLTGVVLIVLGIALIFVGLAFITSTMKSLVADRLEESLNRVLQSGGGAVALLLGIAMTIAVQSSSITTSVLVPIAAAGIITLPNVYPVTLGANLGTTVTALIASLATDRPEALTIALVHTLFNTSGILIFYPVPAMRRIPIRLAEGLATICQGNRTLLPTYVFGAFVIAPLVGVLIFG